MKNFIASVVTVAALSSGALAQSFQVNTPLNVVECVPTQVNWVGGTPPYTLLIQTPDANGAIIQQVGSLTSTSYTWATNFSANQQVGFTVRDNTGLAAQSGPTLIHSGTDSSCLNGGAAPSGASSDASGQTSAPAGSSTASSGTAAGTSSAAGGTSSAPAGSSSGTSRPAGSSTSGGSGATPSPTGGASDGNGNGALANTAAMGAVGFLGAVVAAILA